MFDADDAAIAAYSPHVRNHPTLIGPLAAIAIRKGDGWRILMNEAEIGPTPTEIAIGGDRSVFLFEASQNQPSLGIVDDLGEGAGLIIQDQLIILVRVFTRHRKNTRIANGN